MTKFEPHRFSSQNSFRMLAPRGLRGFSLPLALMLILLAAGKALAQGLFVNPMQSPRQPNELDTADRDGQAGGQQLGINYQLVNLRCQSGEAIVSLRIRRGDVLDFVQIGCATPRCGNRGCTWSGMPNWEMWAGNPYGGDPHPDMICGPSQMVSGFRGRVVTFVPAGAAGFDYAADLEIQCSRMIAPPTAAGFIPVSQFGAIWHHPEGGLGSGYFPPNAASNVNTPTISCPNGWAQPQFQLALRTSLSPAWCRRFRCSVPTRRLRPPVRNAPITS